MKEIMEKTEQLMEREVLIENPSFCPLVKRAYCKNALAHHRYEQDEKRPLTVFEASQDFRNLRPIFLWTF